MRRAGCVLAILAAVLCSAACNDSSQPTQGGSSVLGVEIDAQGDVTQYDCYDRFLIGSPPTFDRSVCYSVGLVSLGQHPVPWRYSFRVIRLAAGETFPEVVAGSVNNGGTFPVFGSAARFDTIVNAAPIRGDEPPYTFQNPRRVSGGHQDFFTSSLQEPGGSLRPPLPLPTVNVIGIASASPGVNPRYELELHPGDSVIIEAAKEKIGPGPPIFPPGVTPKVTISGHLFVGGNPTNPHAGAVQSSINDGSGISFNYISD
jgi:hypothetical protein